MYVTWEVEMNSFKFFLLEFFDYFSQVFEDIFWAGIDTFLIFFKHLSHLFFVIQDPRKISQWTIIFLQKKQDGQILKEKQSQFGFWISNLLWSKMYFYLFIFFAHNLFLKIPSFFFLFWGTFIQLGGLLGQGLGLGLGPLQSWRSRFSLRKASCQNVYFKRITRLKKKRYNMN